jgi:hypothetical protein
MTPTVGELRVVLLPRVEAQVFGSSTLPGAQNRLNLSPTQSGAMATGCPRSSCSRLAMGQTISGLGLPFGCPRWDARMAAYDRERIESWKRSAVRLSLVISWAGGRQRYVEVHADKHSLVPQVEISDGDFGHRWLIFELNRSIRDQVQLGAQTGGSIRFEQSAGGGFIYGRLAAIAGFHLHQHPEAFQQWL